MKKYLVTGGSGFLGSHLCNALLKKGHKVISIDNLLTGQITNISDLTKNKNFEFIEHDITDKINLNVDGIFNLACPASPKKYQIDPIDTAKTCFIGSLNMLELAKKNNVRILQASTSEIYGQPLTHPQSEKYFGNVNTTGPRSCYDEGKRIAETLFNDFHTKYNLSIKIARIFNTYGPRMASDDGRVVSNFITQCLRNENITIYGKGNQTRCFCYVDDLISGILKLYFSKKEIVFPINIGSNTELTILSLAKKVISMTGSNSKLKYNKIPVDDPNNRKPSIKMASKFLNWKPRVSLDKGLQKTIEYFKENN